MLCCTYMPLILFLNSCSSAFIVSFTRKTICIFSVIILVGVNKYLIPFPFQILRVKQKHMTFGIFHYLQVNRFYMSGYIYLLRQATLLKRSLFTHFLWMIACFRQDRHYCKSTIITKECTMPL